MVLNKPYRRGGGTLEETAAKRFRASHPRRTREALGTHPPTPTFDVIRADTPTAQDVPDG
ncbi:hypothetical protein GCM10010483_21050 [Actinokineospora diospyrosa]